MSDRDHYLPDRETVLSRSLSAQMRETERPEEENGRLKAQLHRALAEGAGLREAVSAARYNPLLGGDAGAQSVRAQLGRALAASPLAKLAGEVSREALSVDWDAVLAGNATGLKGLISAVDSLRAELAREGEKTP